MKTQWSAWPVIRMCIFLRGLLTTHVTHSLTGCSLSWRRALVLSARQINNVQTWGQTLCWTTYLIIHSQLHTLLVTLALAPSNTWLWCKWISLWFMESSGCFHTTPLHTVEVQIISRQNCTVVEHQTMVKQSLCWCLLFTSYCAHITFLAVAVLTLYF